MTRLDRRPHPPRAAHTTSRWRIGRGATETALTLAEVVTALGRHPLPPHRVRTKPSTVAVDQIVGTLARPGEFDRTFRPRHPRARTRRRQVAALAGSGATSPPVRLVRVGELYFVDDGHHRVSLARTRGQRDIDAAVRSVCSIAYACACLTRAHLDLKAAERDFLHQVPLPDPALRDLWLDHPEHYQVLAAAARSWSDHQRLTCPHPDCVIDTDVAAAWWDTEVLPHVHAIAENARHPGRPPSTAAAYLHQRGPQP